MQNPKERRSLLDKSPTFQLRPHFGYGDRGSRHYGVRVLLNSSDTQTYGLELTKFKTNRDEFLAIGILLEQRLWEWFNMSVGTVGYFNHRDKNSIGLISNLGWEPNNHIPFKPFITYRNDMIFGKDTTETLHSISAGLKFEF